MSQSSENRMRDDGQDDEERQENRMRDDGEDNEDTRMEPDLLKLFTTEKHCEAQWLLDWERLNKGRPGYEELKKSYYFNQIQRTFDVKLDERSYYCMMGSTPGVKDAIFKLGKGAYSKDDIVKAMHHISLYPPPDAGRVYFGDGKYKYTGAIERVRDVFGSKTLMHPSLMMKLDPPKEPKELSYPFNLIHKPGWKFALQPDLFEARMYCFSSSFAKSKKYYSPYKASCTAKYLVWSTFNIGLPVAYEGPYENVHDSYVIQLTNAHSVMHQHKWLSIGDQKLGKYEWCYVPKSFRDYVGGQRAASGKRSLIERLINCIWRFRIMREFREKKDRMKMQKLWFNFIFNVVILRCLESPLQFDVLSE